MPLDPLSALALAGNVFQVVDFTCKLFQGTRSIYKSASGVGKENDVLETITADLSHLVDNIIISSEHSEELRSLAAQAKCICTELLEALENVRVHGRKTKWKCFVAALKEAWSSSRLDEISGRLFALRSQINMRMQAMMSCEISKLSSDIQSLELNDARLDLRMHTVVLSMKESENALRAAFGQHPTATNNSTSPASRDVLESGENDRFQWLKGIEAIENLSSEVVAMQQDQQLLSSLWFESINVRRDNLASAHTGTFSWMFDEYLPDNSQEIHFVDWLQNHSGTFWINGKAGSGKSTLMKYLTNHKDTLLHLNHWAGEFALITARFFFWNSGTTLQKSQAGLLRSLLFEIVRQCPNLLSHVRTARARFSAKDAGYYAQEGKPYAMLLDQFIGRQSNWSLDELLFVYQCLVEHKVSAKFCFFIDGLDEYKAEGQHDHRDLVKTLQKLAVSPNIKLCLSSRPWTVFSDAFSTNTLGVLKLEDLTKLDIHRYVSDKLIEHDQFQKLARRHPGYQGLIGEVVERAQGVFLWVFLVVRDLLDGLTYNDTIKTMQLRLSNFPKDLERYFQQMIDSIPIFYRKDSARTFHLATSIDEPLPLLTYAFMDELAEDPSLGLNDARFHLEPSHIEEKYDTMRRRLDGRCKGLIEVVANNYTSNKASRFMADFLHRTVRDYLVCSEDIQNFIQGECGTARPIWINACRATIFTLHAVAAAVAGPKYDGTEVEGVLRTLFHFMFLALQDGTDPSALNQVFDEAEKIANKFDIRATINIACEYGLLHHVKRKLRKLYTARNGSLQIPTIVSDRLLAEALVPNPVSGELHPNLVSYLIKVGANPHRPPLKTRFQSFLGTIQGGEILPTQRGLLEVVKLLWNSGDHKLYNDARIDLESDIRLTFSRSEATLILNQEPEPPNHKGRKRSQKGHQNVNRKRRR